MMQPTSLLVVDPDTRGLETLTFGFEREGCMVTGTADPRRAELLARTANPGLAIVAAARPGQALAGSHRRPARDRRRSAGAGDWPVVAARRRDGSGSDRLPGDAHLPARRDQRGPAQRPHQRSCAEERRRQEAPGGRQRRHPDAPVRALRPLLPAAGDGRVRANRHPADCARQPPRRAAHSRRHPDLGQRRGDARAARPAPPAAVGGGGGLAAAPAGAQAQPVAPFVARAAGRMRALPARLRPLGQGAGRAPHDLRARARPRRRGARPSAQPDDAAAAPVRRPAGPFRRHRGQPVPDLRHRPDDPAPARGECAGQPPRRPARAGADRPRADHARGAERRRPGRCSSSGRWSRTSAGSSATAAAPAAACGRSARRRPCPRRFRSSPRSLRRDRTA